MLGTDTAWEVQDKLEEFYFSRKADSIQPEEPPRLPYATKAQREPLIKAVRHLVIVANAKGRELTYENAHSIINLKMGVDSIEALTVEQIPKAMTLVGEILERVVLEGEYLAKDEEDFQPLPEPEPRLSSSQRHELNKAIRHALAGAHQECGEGGEQWVYNRLRIKLHLRNIDDMHPDQLPDALAEVKQLEQDLRGYFSFRYEQREFICREIIGAGTPWTPTLAKNWKAQLKQLVPARPDWLAMKKKLKK
jgi:hypothetical protein